MFVGEQPGDQEDCAGYAFVRPGRFLDRGLEEAGIDRSKVYVTNVVKHQWLAAERRKRRIHKTPSGLEIQLCRPWIEAEIRIVRPQVLACLGATAAQALLGKSFRVNTPGGQFVDSELAPYATATIHPSSILRAPDDAARQAPDARALAKLRNLSSRLWGGAAFCKACHSDPHSRSGCHASPCENANAVSAICDTARTPPLRQLPPLAP